MSESKHKLRKSVWIVKEKYWKRKKICHNNGWSISPNIGYDYGQKSNMKNASLELIIKSHEILK